MFAMDGNEQRIFRNGVRRFVFYFYFLLRLCCFVLLRVVVAVVDSLCFMLLA